MKLVALSETPEKFHICTHNSITRVKTGTHRFERVRHTCVNIKTEKTSMATYLHGKTNVFANYIVMVLIRRNRRPPCLNAICVPVLSDCFWVTG